ncbi:hypothetical protein J3E68DRAFT_182051 [Trichoderma sp. SZMC 28012]
MRCSDVPSRPVLDSTHTHRYNQYSSHAHPKLTRDTGQAVAAHRLGVLSTGLSNTRARTSTALLKDAEQKTMAGPLRMVGELGKYPNGFPDKQIRHSARHPRYRLVLPERALCPRFARLGYTYSYLQSINDQTLSRAFARFITAKARHIRSGCQNAWGSGRNGGHCLFRQLQQAGLATVRQRIQKGPLHSVVPPRRNLGEQAGRSQSASPVNCARSVIFCFFFFAAIAMKSESQKE